MRILVYGSTRLTELCVKQLLKDGYNLVGFIPSNQPTFPGEIPLPIVEETIPHDIKLSIQYDKKLIAINDAYNLHTGLLPEYGGRSILYHTIKDKAIEQGLTLHKMTESFDEGPIISKITYPVREQDTVADLYERMCILAPKFISNALQIINIQGKILKPRLFVKDSIPVAESEKDTIEIKKRINTRCCKVIAISFSPNRDVRNQAIFPNHNQHGGTQEDVRKMIEELYNMEMKEDAGLPMDTYFINSDVGYERGNKWLDEINGSQTKNGTLTVLHRKNIGGSFGAYDFAFRTLRDRYEYFLFTEDDLFIFGQNYYRKAVKFFERYSLGFLAFIDIEWVRNIVHAHGGVGLTSRTILDRVFLKHGELPHFKGQWNDGVDKQQVIREGEIPFTNSIYQMGYELERFGCVGSWSAKNHILPHYEYVRSA